MEEKENELKFPNGFLWGTATSSYQIEGGINNCDWAQANRGPSTSSGHQIPDAGRACDSYNKYEEDFDIAKSLGQNAHRFSIEWARIEPEEGKFDEKEIEHYKKVLDALRTRPHTQDLSVGGTGLEPFVTLWHFTLPVWFAKMGGFENPKSPEIFSRYCEFVVGKMGDRVHPVKSGEAGAAERQFNRVKFWVTINEPMVYASNGYRKGQWPPFEKNIFRFMKVIKNLIMSHNLAYDKIKNIDPSAQIGIAKNNINFEANWNPINRLLSSFLNFFWNRRFLNKISQDFIGLNYYFHKKFGDRAKYPKSDMGWDIYPKGIYNLLMELKKYGKPVYITENGLADKEDKQRADFIREHLKWVSRAIRDGSDCRGYFYWSLLDNFEWAEGYKQKFGLVEINFETMERKIRNSAWEFAKICKNNEI
ncbi:MAG: glycoside hydrolase family 1 protein [Minisyncoccia bacterium]